MMFCSVVLSLAGLGLIANALILAGITNFHFGIIATLLLGAFLLVYGCLFRKINMWTRRGVLRFLRYAVYAGFLFFLGVVLFAAGYGMTDDVTYDEEALIVLGAAVQGETVSLPLAHRLERAVFYHSKNPNAVILVSGGRGPQEHVTEAYAMEQYLLERGVPQDKIMKEEKATSTFGNFKYAKEILDEAFPDGYQTAFVTNDFHVYRAKRLAENIGLETNRLHAKTEWYTLSVNYTREFCAILKMWLLGT